jgi:hypothetical protein
MINTPHDRIPRQARRRGRAAAGRASIRRERGFRQGPRAGARARERNEVPDHGGRLLELDDAPREVELPPELAEAREEFERLSYTHKREYAEWIAGAKREETRRRRAAKAVEMLRAGTKHP